MSTADRAARYHRLQLLLGALELALTVLFLAAVLISDAGAALATLGGRVWGARWWQVGVVAVALGVGHGLVAFPLAWLRGYWLPCRYGLLHQPLRGWLADRLKAALVGGGLAFGAVEVIYGLIAATPLWWLLAAGIFAVVQIGLAVIFPIWLLPLFYRLAPLTDDALSRRLLGLARRAGVAVIGVWVADQSRKSRTANAALAGLGRTRRIILFDTLVGEFTPDEVESVLAHELAHHVHRDTWRGLVVQTGLTVVALWLVDRLLNAVVTARALAGPADPGGLPWLAAILLGLGVLATPLANGFSRWIERQADDFALALTGDPGAFVAAMERLAALNLAERRPHPLKEMLLHSHPSIDRRIARALATAR
ncbi:MAG TPA: M48 family metalloprotease [Methylomirabilota bacterium]|jgi:STE24 endopeptidase